MPKSLHLIHRGRKARGDLRKQKPPLSLVEVRRKVVLPYKPQHVDEKSIQAAIEHLNER